MIKKTTLYIFIAINIAVALAMIFCAYSTYLPPQRYPNWSFFGMLFPFALALNVPFLLLWLVFKRRMLWLPIGAMLLCASAIRTFCPINFSRPAPKGSIKVMSYNVLWFSDPEAKGWSDNRMLKYINDADADIVCMQECMASNPDEAFNMMKSHYPYQERIHCNENYMALLSKHPILSTERINYPSKTNISYAHRVKVGEDTVLVINNHFESYHLAEKDKENYKNIVHNPKEHHDEASLMSLKDKIVAANAIRGPQADAVAEYVEQYKGKYVIVVGDFNDPSLSYTHHRLTERLNDAYTRSGNGMGISYNLHNMYFRIDNLLCSPNITPYEAKVDQSISLSDHYPISASFMLEHDE